MSTGAISFNIGNSGSNPAISFGSVPETQFTESPQIPVDKPVPGSVFADINDLASTGLAYLKQIQNNDLQNELIAANRGQGGVAATSTGTTATGAGALSGAFGGANTSGTFFGIPIAYLVIGLVLIIFLRR